MRQLWSFKHSKPKVTLAPNVSSMDVIRAGQGITDSMPKVSLTKGYRRLRRM